MLVAVSVASVLLVNEARQDSGRVIHTVEVENQISTLLLEVRRAESSARGYLLTNEARFLSEHEAAVAAVRPGVDKLTQLIADSPVQVANGAKLRNAIEARLKEFERAVDFVKRGDQLGGVEMLRQAGASGAVPLIREAGDAMRAEEDRLFAVRTAKADSTQRLASLVTVAGSALIILLAIGSIYLVRRSARARDAAEQKLRENYLNLETAIAERTADLSEANEEIQRFAYIVSHDLRSPLVNIMGFTSELEELRFELFRRIASLSRPSGAAEPADHVEPAELDLTAPDRQLAADFSEALGFIKSSIGKMDRLISAILNLTREGRRKFRPERIETGELIEGIVQTVAHQAMQADATVEIDKLPAVVSDRLALEQIFSNLIDNALKYLRSGVPGRITVRGKLKLGFAVFEVNDNGRGIDEKDHQRIFDLFRRAGVQDRPGQGIGLAHVRALVRRLGGTMSVSSSLGVGSTFTITLPARWSAGKQESAA